MEHQQPSLSSLALFLFHLHLSFSVAAALEKKSPNIGSGVEVAPGLAAAAASSSRGGSLQSRGSGGHLSPSLTSNSPAAHQGQVKKEPMDMHQQGISSSSRSRGFSPDLAAHQYHAAAAAASRGTPPHVLSHPSPYSAAYPYPDPAAKLPPSLSGLRENTFNSVNLYHSCQLQDHTVDPPICLSCTTRNLTSTEPKDRTQLRPTLERSKQSFFLSVIK